MQQNAEEGQSVVGDAEVLYFIDSHAHLDMVLDRLTDNRSAKTQADFTDFFDANWTESAIRDLFTATKGAGGFYLFCLFILI
jgi:CelD/BcsL family acetyltransferase involved in cellulose biosynthesis